VNRTSYKESGGMRLRRRRSGRNGLDKVILASILECGDEFLISTPQFLLDRREIGEIRQFDHSRMEEM